LRLPFLNFTTLGDIGPKNFASASHPDSDSLSEGETEKKSDREGADGDDGASGSIDDDEVSFINERRKRASL
jgi:hypothetical protein